MSCLILSDIHGCMNTLTRLLNKAPKGSKVVFGGDLIDRGPHSRQVVEFAMENAIPTVCGNHEDLCLAFYDKEGCEAHCGGMYDSGVWLSNGGDKAAANWPTIDKRSIHWRRDEYAGGRVPNEVLDWMAALPAYLFPSEELDENGRRLCVTHTGYGLDADKGNWFRALWGRRGYDSGPWAYAPDTGEEVDDGLFRVYGHTRVDKVVVTESECNIDSGGAYGGGLTGLLWPSKQLLYQPFDERPVVASFGVRSGVLVDP